MAYTITSESYGRRLPKITATADSTDDLATLGTNWAEGSTCVISDTTYKLDKVQGWVDPSSGGGGGDQFIVHYNMDSEDTPVTESYADILAAIAAGKTIVVHVVNSAGVRVLCTSWQYWPESPGTVARIFAHDLMPSGNDETASIGFFGVNIEFPADSETLTAEDYNLYFSAEWD